MNVCLQTVVVVDIDAGLSAKDARAAKIKREREEKKKTPQQKHREQMERDEADRLQREAKERALAAQRAAAPVIDVYGIAKFSLADLFRGSLEWSMRAEVLPIYPPRQTGTILPLHARTNPYQLDGTYVTNSFVITCLSFASSSNLPPSL
jgi:hypothetical protein